MKKFLSLSVLITILMSTIVMAQLPKPPQCNPTTRTSANSYISNVRLGTTINNSSLRGTNGYSDYRNMSVNEAIGSHNTITVTSSTLSKNNSVIYHAKWIVYIDYNRNGLFSDAGELVDSITVLAKTSTSLTFTIPTNAFSGPAILRVQMYQSNNTNACVGYFDDGETEDYTVNITGSFCSSHGIHSANDYISSVAVAGITKTSGNDGGYANYTSTTFSMTSGFTYPIALSHQPSPSQYEYWSVFIDYNFNKSFADAGDLVALVGNPGTATADIKIPFLTTQMTGTTRMRVIMSHDKYITNPCDTVSNGEVEDYSVKLMPPVLGTGKEANLMASINMNEAAVSVQPNPATSSHAIVKYTVAAGGNTNIRVTDLSGRLISESNAGNKTAGTYTYALFSSRSLAAGTYLIMLEQNGQAVAHSKFIVVQ